MSRIIHTSIVGVALAGALLVALSADHADGAAPHAPALRSPFPFGHEAHARTFAKNDVVCTDCHAVGALPVDGVVGSIEASRAVCHGCHLQTRAGAPRNAPSACATCHTGRDGLVPANHDAAWMTAHGDLARAPHRTASSLSGERCSDCHAPDQCIDCHDARGAGTNEPHPPGFRETHGIEARLDPRACSTCHTGSSCSTCHVAGSLPW